MLSKNKLQFKKNARFVIMKAKEISERINHLKCYKVYDYSSISKDLKNDRDNIAVKISREAKKGMLVKIGKGKFYKRNIPLEEQFVNRVLVNKPKDKSSLKYGKIIPSKYPSFKKLFWSNNSNPIPLGNFISKIIEQDVIGYFADLRVLFGDRKIIEVYLNNFYPNSRKINFEEFFKI